MRCHLSTLTEQTLEGKYWGISTGAFTFYFAPHLQVCAKGLFHSEQNTCLPCNCKGRADYCEDITGICINCRDHSTGDFCEMCEDGYMLARDLDETNITGVNYYYGNPMAIGNSCKHCDCNGNSDPNLIFSECHNVTGHCQHCWGNTAGANCERCAPGFYGDAISAKNCRGCDCESGHCDMHTGECLVEAAAVNLCNISCDECIWHLIGDLRLSNKTVDQLKVGVLNISTGAAANDRLKYYNYTAHRLQVNARVRQLEKKLMLTDGRLPPVREILSRFSTQLSNTQGFLQKAASTIQETEDKNRASILKFQRNEVMSPYTFHCHFLHPSLSQHISHSNVTGYHAAIDGASQKLMEKTERLSLADRDLVQRADEHAKELERQANELEEDLRDSDANGFVQRAISAANVYNNIVKYIDDANITSLTTLNLCQRAEDVFFCFVLCCLCFPVENLNVLVPELLDKLKVVEEKKPVNNVTTNIVRIRELIAQARSVARKVQVSMKFNGQSSVEVHPYSNPEELKTMTSISLFMRVDPDKDPIEDRFILYLGDRNGRKDYMGLAVKNDNLVYVYNLGGEDVEIPLSSKPVSQWPAVFNYIKVLGRHGKVFLTVPSQGSTDEQKFIQKGEAPGTDSLFDVDPKDLVFFVGGVPPDVRLPPPLSLAPFVGCIELASLNNDVISLYNFKATHKMDVVTSAPCPRYKLAFSQSRIASYLFDGTGYALISNIERRSKFGVVIRFDIAVRTIANDGVLFLMVSGDKFFLLELKNGFLRLMYDFGFSNGPKLLENDLPKLQINDARYHEVSVIYHQSKKVILLVDKSHVKSMENPKTTLPFSDIYIGGAPSSILKSRPELAGVVSLKGCVKGFQFQKKDFNLLEEPGTIGISSGCPEEFFMSHKAYFTGESYLGSIAKISPFDNFEGGLNFRTLQQSGLLFYYSEGSDEFSIYLENGGVVLNSRGIRVKSHKKQYNDGMTHFLVASVNNQKQDRDIEPEDFQRYTEKVQTSLQDCPVQRPPAALLSRYRDNTSRAKHNQPQKVKRKEHWLLEDIFFYYLFINIQPCYLSSSPKATPQAFHYGGITNSRQSHFSLSLKTHSSFGLIFYVSDVQEDNFMALFLAHGKLVYTFNVADQKVKIKSEDRYNDGEWHDVIFVRDGSMGRLIIDGLTVLEDRAQGSNISWHVSGHLYVGGVPPGKAQKNIQRNSAHSFTGCLKNLQLDGQWLSSVTEMFGVTPCFEGLSEAGTYFSEEGGYIVLDEFFDLGSNFELVMEVRPRVASGLLLHVHTAEGYFTIYIHQGAVVVTVNTGTNEFSTKVSPRQSLCAGKWHRITVTRNANIVQLNVDSEVNHVEAPLNTSSTDARKPVFIGGAPESITTRKAYVGCIRNLAINNSRVTFSKAALVSGAVSIGTCPAA
uniref:Laminin, alpha 4 n=1 Tax=Mastacembelus armatus TaxID=205130 RepID=A0A7N8YPK9_9TELE